MQVQPPAAMSRAGGHLPARAMLPRQTVAGPVLGTGLGRAGPDPAHRPALARRSEAEPAVDPEIGPEVEDQRALDLLAVSGFEPVAGAADQPALAPPPVATFGSSAERQPVPGQTAAVGLAAELGTVAELGPGAESATASGSGAAS
jgi:hypothetical protein